MKMMRKPVTIEVKPTPYCGVTVADDIKGLPFCELCSLRDPDCPKCKLYRTMRDEARASVTHIKPGALIELRTSQVPPSMFKKGVGFEGTDDSLTNFSITPQGVPFLFVEATDLVLSDEETPEYRMPVVHIIHDEAVWVVLCELQHFKLWEPSSKVSSLDQPFELD